MKKIILFLLFINLTFSQDIPYENYYWFTSYDGRTEGIIGAKNCYIREEATTNSTLIDSLQIGAKIKVLNNTAFYLNIKGLNLSWLEIQYKKDNKIKTGFVWKGFVALGSTERNATTFLTTIDSKYTKTMNQDDYEYEGEFYRISVKAIDSDNQILDEKTFSEQLSESSYFQNSAINSWGLKNLSDIYRISFGGEACGIPKLYYYFGWNGTEFLILPKKYEVGDADVFSHSEEFIFPKEKNGQPNTIIKEIEESEQIEESKDGTYSIYETRKSTEYYSWDGKNFKLIKTKKMKPYIKKEN